MVPYRLAEILEQVQKVDPIRYGKTRNYLDGAVSRLSPYISRGVISTRFVFQAVLDRGYDIWQIEKFVQELAWRDYWQQVWIAKGELVNADLRHPQAGVRHSEMPTVIRKARTGIEAIDAGIKELYATGYMHNHLRMYTAALACNVGKSHWKTPARWMYYHLFDADWASNALSWQWVVGSNSNKKYYANQENINKYCHTRQRGTLLDVDYAAFPDLPISEILLDTELPELKTELPARQPLQIDPELPTLIYNFYNLDPYWREQEPANRVLLLEPSHFAQYPISSASLDFTLRLAENIPGIQVFPGEWSALIADYAPQNIFYKEHPLNSHYQGTQVPRDWMFNVQGYFRSFFAFWKKCKRELRK